MSEGKGVGRSQLLVDSLLDRWVIVEDYAVTADDLKHVTTVKKRRRRIQWPQLSIY